MARSAPRVSRRRGSTARIVLAGLGLLALAAVAAVIFVVLRGREPEDVAEDQTQTVAAAPQPVASKAAKPASAEPDAAAAQHTPGKPAVAKPASGEPAAAAAQRSPVKPAGAKPASGPPAAKPPQPPVAKPVVEPDDGLPAFAEVACESRPGDKPLTVAELQTLLEPVRNPFRATPVPNQPACKFQGLARVRGWTAGSLLRYDSLHGGNALRVHVWGQKQGVTLRLYPHWNVVAAYRTLQDPGQGPPPAPAVAYGELLATDDGRNARLPPGAYHVSFSRGAVVVSRGVLPLLRAPLEGPVAAAYVEAPDEMEVRDLAVLRSKPAPEHPPAEHRLVLDGARPADLDWKSNLPAARLEKRGDGSLEFSAEKLPSMAVASLAGPTPGLYAVVFQVEEATPGAGIGLLSETGEIIEGLDYTRDAAGKLLFGDPGWTAGDRQPGNLAGPGQWLRLVVAGGMVRWWVSGDGVHWGQVFDPRQKPGLWRSVGLYLRPNVPSDKPNEAPKPGESPRRIRLRHLQVRELDGLTSCVPDALRRKAAAAGVQLQANETIPAWAARIAPLAPPDCAPGAWRSACALEALAGATSAEPAAALLDGVLAERLENLPALAARVRLLEDAALVQIRRIRDDDDAYLAAAWDRLGRAVLDAGGAADFFAYQQRRLAAPVGGGLMSPGLANEALLVYYAERRGADLEKLVRGLIACAAFSPAARPLVAEPRLVEWMEARPEVVAARGGRPAEVPQPLLFPASRTAANIFQEVENALESQQSQEAARLVTGAALPRDEGLVPAPHDPQLLVSLRVALRSMALRHRGFAGAMSAAVGRGDELRLQQTLARNDPAAIEMLAIQYTGTPPAAAACQWLGDWALGAADFSRALAWYEEGLAAASAEQRPDLAARVRLASAMLGSPRGQPVGAAVAFGERRVGAELFERQVAEAAQRQRALAGRASPRDSLAVLAIPAPARLQLAAWGEFDEGPLRPGRPLLPAIFGSLDGSLVSSGAVADDDLLLVSNRRRLAAVELSGGKARWTWDLGETAFPCPLRPVVAGQRVYVRSMTAPGRYGVACLDRKTGHPLWLRDCEDDAIGDPQLARGRIYVLTLGPPGGAVGLFNAPLRTVELDAAGGEILARRHLADAVAQPAVPHQCQSALVGDRWVILLSGDVLCLDLQGRVQWVRQSASPPPEVDPGFAQQQFQPPLADGDRLFVQQPGRRAVECLSVETGETLWRRGVAGLQRILDLHQGRLVVKTVYGLAAVDAATGAIAWRREIPGMLAGVARTADGTIFSVRRRVQVDKADLVELWVDAATGKIKAHSVLPLKNTAPAALGPIAVGAAGAWALGNREFPLDLGQRAGALPIIALKPDGPATPGEPP